MLTAPSSQALEASYPHATATVELLTRAQAQFRKYSVRRIPLPKDAKGQQVSKPVVEALFLHFLGSQALLCSRVKYAS